MVLSPGAPGSASAGRGFCFVSLCRASRGPLGCFRDVSGVHVWAGCCKALRLAPAASRAYRRACVCVRGVGAWRRRTDVR
nr:MAG TPA: hypothetical protein [Caudoviricetes sp.]